jgi:endonuclease/exonuclease/phosphatase family metal-dependent hydrolase
MKRFVALAFMCALGLSPSPSAQAETSSTNLTFTTFNIEWYGLGGSMKGSLQDEHRNDSLKKFIAKELASSDIISFQEVVDVDGVKKNLLPAGWGCESYQHASEKHQHVVLCHRAGLQFNREPSDDNDIIDVVAGNDGHSRPALHLIVSDSSGRPITRVIGVHLKAFPNYAVMRYSQAKKIGMYLQTVADTNLPVVILGDFNTYPAKTNGKDDDDALNIQTVLNKYQKGMSEVKGKFINSYRTAKLGSYFDRIYRSANVSVVNEASAYSACNSKDVSVIAAYNETISDHCPVSATLKFTR